MAGIETKSVDSPDEERSFDKGKVELVTIGDVTLGRATFEPGWKWSECVKPIVQTDSCQVLHSTYIISGRLRIVHNDGTDVVVGPGDLAVVQPGHDAWVEGGEPCVTFDFSTAGKDYAKPAS